VGHSTFYIYFPSKMVLFTECVDRVFQQMFSGVWEEIKGEKNPIERLRKRGETVLKSYPQFIDMMNVLKSIEEDEPALEKKKREIYQSIVETVKRDLKNAVEAGLIQVTDVEVAAYVIVGFLESAWLLMSINKDCSADHILSVIDGLVLQGKPGT
jgi:AcrR family transcriptional regulator